MTLKRHVYDFLIFIVSMSSKNTSDFAPIIFAVAKQLLLLLILLLKVFVSDRLYSFCRFIFKENNLGDRVYRSKLNNACFIGLHIQQLWILSLKNKLLYEISH